MGLRPGVTAFLEEAVRAGLEGGSVVFVAPPGYCTGACGPELYRRLSASAGPARLVHVASPGVGLEGLAALYRSRLGSTASVGLRLSMAGLPGESLLLASDVVVAGLDSLAYEALGLRAGHYEVPRAHLASAFVLFDDAHVAARGVGGPGAAAAAVRLAAGLGAPVAVVSSTYPAWALGGSSAAVVIAGSLSGCWLPELPGGSRLIVVDDDEYFEWAGSVTWMFEALGGRADAALLAAELAEEGLRVYVAAGGPWEAAEIGAMVESALGGGVAVLHGGMTLRERLEAAAGLDSARVIVGDGTELALEFDADVLVAAAPGLPGGELDLEGLIARVGRVCRGLGRCACYEATVYLYGPGAREASRILEGVNPRLPCTLRPRDRPRRVRPLPRQGSPEDLCSILGGEALVPVVVAPRGWSLRDGVEPLVEAVERGDYALVKASSALTGIPGARLVTFGESLAVLAAAINWEAWGHPAGVSYGLDLASPAILESCRSLARAHARHGVVALVASRD